MKRVARVLFLLTIVLAVAQPTFACTQCLWTGECIWGGPGPRCKWNIDGGCVDGPWCGGRSEVAEPLAAEFQIASVEISHESDVKVAETTKVRTEAPAAIAEANAASGRK